MLCAGGLEVQQGMNETKHEAQTRAWKRGKGDAFLDRLEVATRTLTYIGQRRILSSNQQGQAGLVQTFNLQPMSVKICI
jgi:hypothetical protein